MRKLFFTIAFLGVVSNICIYGQLRKKSLTPNDYDTFSTLLGENIAPDGKWISYTLDYDVGNDTLFLQHLKTAKKQAFSLATDARFSPDGKWFTAMHSQKGMLLQNLTTGVQRWFKETTDSEFFGRNKYLVIRQNQELTVLQLRTNKEFYIHDVENFTTNTAGNTLIFSTMEGVFLFRPENDSISQMLVSHHETSFSNFVWKNDGDALVFMELQDTTGYKLANYKIWYYNDIKTNPKLFCLDTQKSLTLAGKHIVIPNGKEAIGISPHGKRIFFNMVIPEKIAEQKTVEVWDALSPLEYPRQLNIGTGEHVPIGAIWIPSTDKIVTLGSQEQPEVWLTATHNHAITYNSLDYEPQYFLHGCADMYLTDINTGTKKLWLKRQTLEPQTMGSSPDGKYISYFRDGDWWVYDIAKANHTNITKDWKITLFDYSYGVKTQLKPYAGPAWTTDGRLIICSQYDIWIASPDGKNKNRITTGQDSQLKFRISPASEITHKHKSYDLLTQYYDLTEGLVLEATAENRATGYYLWSQKTGLKKWIFTDSKYSHLQKAQLNNKYTILEENTALPPRILFSSKLGSKPTSAFQSNPQQVHFETGKAEWLSYTTPDGKELHGVLFYPAAYIAGKQYPMIVNIYEKQDYRLHQYLKPSAYQAIGFSHANYIADGYLVFCPDIVYDLGSPGKSAVTCVEAGVHAVIDKGIVDSGHIGLIGHSYGGYETSYIITQSKLFACAVAGAGVTDMVSASLSMREGAARSQMWRYETYQPRIGKSLYESYEKYINNSPISQAANISTPLLSWSGKEDQSVNYSQSMELHLAMRRLQKRHVLLLYNGEGHLLEQTRNQLDLNGRIRDWFAYYLKGKPFTYDEF